MSGTIKIKKSQIETLIKEHLDQLSHESKTSTPSYQDVNELLGSDIFLKEVISRVKKDELNKIVGDIVQEYDLKIPLHILKNRK